MTAIAPWFSARDAERPIALPTSSTEPAESFSALLAGTGSADGIQPSRTYGFAELGMFGLHGSQAMPANAPISQPSTSWQGREKPEVAEASAAAIGEAPARAGTLIDSGSASDLGQPSVGPPQERQSEGPTGHRDIPQIQLVSSRIATLIASYIEEGETGRSQGVADPGRAGMATLEPSKVSVTVTGSGAEVTVIARSDAETPEARARLRQLVEKTLRDFGLGLTGFHLNGSTQEFFDPPAMGKINGNFQR